MENPREWLSTLTTDSLNEISQKSGIPERTFYNQLGKGTLSMENVVKIAEAYDAHPLGALIQAGYVHPRWQEIGDRLAALRQCSPRELADEMVRRIEEAEEHHDDVPEEFTTEISHIGDRRQRTEDHDDYVEPERYVAKKRTKELFEGDDGYGPGA